MIKSAHREVAIWRYDRPSRGYFGLHLRARTVEARLRFRERLGSLTPGTPHLFKLANDMDDVTPAKWERQFFEDCSIAVGVSQGDATITLAPDQHQAMLRQLAEVAPHGESSVTALTETGLLPLWIWWDA